LLVAFKAVLVRSGSRGIARLAAKAEKISRLRKWRNALGNRLLSAREVTGADAPS